MFKNFVGLKIMITDFIKKHKTAFIRIFNLFYFTLLIILGIVCSALMLFGTIKHIVLYLQISAFGFCMRRMVLVPFNPSIPPAIQKLSRIVVFPVFFPVIKAQREGELIPEPA